MSACDALPETANAWRLLDRLYKRWGDQYWGDKYKVALNEQGRGIISLSDYRTRIVIGSIRDPALIQPVGSQSSRKL